MATYNPYHSEFDKVLNLPAIGYKRAHFKELLEDLQANILKHHRKRYSNHLFVSFNTSREEAVRWISPFAGSLTSAMEQLEQRKTGEKAEGEVIYGAYLSAEGYDFLGVRHLIPGNCSSFGKGLRTEITASFAHADDFDEPFSEGNKIHLMILLACDDELSLANAVNDILRDKKGRHQLILDEIADVTTQPGFMLENEKKELTEWFGYRDGINDLHFFPDAHPDYATKFKALKESEIPEMSMVLTKDPGGSHRNSAGSFFAFLKLRQDVAAFDALTSHIANAIPAGTPALAKAYLMGRFSDGTPVTLFSQNTLGQGSNNDFDFTEQMEMGSDYQSDSAGSRCPMHAHIRKANPRLQNEDYVNRRIARRSVLYGNELNQVSSEISEKPEGIVGEAKSYSEVGMLFMSFQSNLERQFEYILKWMHGNFSNGIATGKDILIGKPDDWQRKYPAQWNADGSKANSFIEVNLSGLKPVVEYMGGAYFFAPSISFLKAIEKNSFDLSGMSQKTVPNEQSNNGLKSKLAYGPCLPPGESRDKIEALLESLKR